MASKRTFLNDTEGPLRGFVDCAERIDQYGNQHIYLLKFISCFETDTLLTEGGRTLDDLFDTMCMKLGKYLQEIGLIPKNLKTLDLAKVRHKVNEYLREHSSKTVPWLKFFSISIYGIWPTSIRFNNRTEKTVSLHRNGELENVNTFGPSSGIYFCF